MFFTFIIIVGLNDYFRKSNFFSEILMAVNHSTLRCAPLFICWTMLMIFGCKNFKSRKNEKNFLDYVDSFNFPGVYFTIMNVAFYNMTRLMIENKYWISSIPFFSKESKVVVSSINSKTPLNTITYKSKAGQDFHCALINGFIKTMKDFIRNTDLEWYVRTTDDVYIDMQNFAKMMRDLTAQYNPLEDSVVKGHRCVFYLHGGSGWIMSRKAVENALKSLKIIALNSESGDDVIAGELFNKMKQTHTHSTAFLGSPIHPDFDEFVYNKNWDDLKVDCSKQENMLSRIQDVAVWHAGTKSMHIVTNGYQVLRSVPPNIYGFVYKDGQMGFCKK